MLARDYFERGLDVRPQDFWLNFYMGLCEYRRGQLAAALIRFHVCVALSPESPECWYNRALAYASQGQSTAAIRDSDNALELKPDLVEAAGNRGMLHYKLKHYDLALADLQSALARCAKPASIHYNMALVHLALGDRRAPVASLKESLQCDPEHLEARDLQAQLGRR